MDSGLVPESIVECDPYTDKQREVNLAGQKKRSESDTLHYIKLRYDESEQSWVPASTVSEEGECGWALRAKNGQFPKGRLVRRTEATGKQLRRDPALNCARFVYVPWVRDAQGKPLNGHPHNFIPAPCNIQNSTMIKYVVERDRRSDKPWEVYLNRFKNIQPA